MTIFLPGGKKMNYIYDVILNFQKEYYDFYEWNKNDNIYHMRKIPIIKINNKQFFEIKNNTIRFDEETLKFFNTKNILAERFKKNSISKIRNTIILGDEYEALAIKLNKNGLINFKSALLPDEQDDVIEILKFQKEFKLNYQIIHNQKTNNFKTRFELENEKFIINELNKIYNEKNIQKLNYLCLECFNKPEKNINEAYKKLKKEIKKANSNFQKIYEIFKISKQK